MTVIGLPAKKPNKGGGGGSSSDSAASKEKLVPFIKLHAHILERERFVLPESFLLSLSLSRIFYDHNLILYLYTAMLRLFVDPKIVEAVLRKPKGV